MMALGQGGPFKGRHLTSELILWALRWCLALPISHRDLASMLAYRGVVVDHTTVFRWVQAYAAMYGSWRVGETSIKLRSGA